MTPIDLSVILVEPQFLHWRTDFSCIGGETSLARTAFERLVCLPVAPSIA